MGALDGFLDEDAISLQWRARAGTVAAETVLSRISVELEAAGIAASAGWAAAGPDGGIPAAPAARVASG